ncbi:MAG: 5'-nucleotidase, lipoprotein e(P4) family [Bacteroidales bacterium]|nr:5'-nucleotidase, lipoprotein e(P4) family [Bacteroidales bacterium]MBN2697715.1 5'-nucleotidase, lipoprotein e(P4) family [Bacteroidales bacterium]
MKFRFLILTAAILLTGCSKKPGSADQTYLLQATLWYQHSAEMKALYHQAYNWAGLLVREQNKQPHIKPPAVILDIDETILNNSPSTGFQILENLPFSEELWASWCHNAEAEPLPGALEFTLLADETGVEVFYVSNRTENLLGVTIANMKKHGFPNADTAHVLLKTTTSSKAFRNARVAAEHKVILMIGDNLSDFDEAFEDRHMDAAKKLVGDHSELFGSTYIILPNPIYGSWENPYRTGEGTATEKRKNALVTFKPSKRNRPVLHSVQGL